MAPTTTSPDLDKPKQKRVVPGPRNAYVMLKGERAKEFVTLIESGEIEVIGASRKAEDVLDAVYSGKASAYLRFVVK